MTIVWLTKKLLWSGHQFGAEDSHRSTKTQKTNKNPSWTDQKNNRENPKEISMIKEKQWKCKRKRVHYKKIEEAHGKFIISSVNVICISSLFKVHNTCQTCHVWSHLGLDNYSMTWTLPCYKQKTKAQEGYNVPKELRGAGRTLSQPHNHSLHSIRLGAGASALSSGSTLWPAPPVIQTVTHITNRGQGHRKPVELPEKPRIVPCFGVFLAPEFRRTAQ